MVYFRLIHWFLEYVMFCYCKDSLDDFDKEVLSVLNSIWSLKQEYNEIVGDIHF